MLGERGIAHEALRHRSPLPRPEVAQNRNALPGRRTSLSQVNELARQDAPVEVLGQSPKPGLFARALIGLIRLYQVTLSRLLGPVCRFYPSCSNYTRECLELHGAFRGSYLGVRRILRCHPFHPGGYDPPPR